MSSLEVFETDIVHNLVAGTSLSSVASSYAKSSQVSFLAAADSSVIDPTILQPLLSI